MLRFIRQTLPGPALPSWSAGDIGLRDVLEYMLQTEPRLRWPIREVAALPYWHPPEAEVCLSQVSAERGSFTMVRWQLDPLVLKWLQADP